MGERISVIIPTLNESSCVAATIAHLRALGECEVIVADGGSDDGTVAQASGADRVLTGARGRSAQMNFGASAATGELLLFLHADCRPEAGAFAEVRRWLRKGGVAAGCFRMRVEAPGLAYRMIDEAATARVRLTGLIYGDQGLFVRRETFDRVGGFPPLRFMEDVFISRSLRRLGRMAVADKRVFVSDRRWRKVGVVRQTLQNWTLTALAMAGVSPDRLAAYYPVVR